MTDGEREAEFVRAVLAAPRDDGPRLVYADWLLERGDPRGELVQVQCELGWQRRLWTDFFHSDEPEPPPNADAFLRREKRLLRDHEATWLAPVRPFLEHGGWNRGFLDSAHVTPAFFDGAEALFAAHPIDRLLLQRSEGTDGASYAPLATTPLGSVRTLFVHDLDASELPAVLGANLARVEHLHISNNPIGPAGAAKLAHESHLRAVRYLGLAQCGLGDAGLVALATSPIFAEVEEIDIAGNGVTSAGILDFVASCRLPRLRTLARLSAGALNEPESWSPDAEAALAERLAGAAK